jgi:hypothetical protein
MTDETGFTLKNKADSPDSEVTDKTKKGVSSEAKDGRNIATVLPAIDFSTFILSLNASALVSLGVMSDPMAGRTARNLPLGKQTIDIIGMLEEKTRGNLTPDEANLIKGVLYDLRITYVKQSS